MSRQTAGDDILVNGQSTGITNKSELPYKAAESLTINKGFVVGFNTLDFVVTNSGVTPPIGFTGQDRFTYSIEDEGGATATAEVLIEVVQK